MTSVPAILRLVDNGKVTELIAESINRKFRGGRPQYEHAPIHIPPEGDPGILHFVGPPPSGPAKARFEVKDKRVVAEFTPFTTWTSDGEFDVTIWHGISEGEWMEL
ncbi:hypothetical protein RSOLAG22IIIB_11590 [Rhizoctonia solani]|uniref:Uncharacterized protein n=1 Tax=Rhizoctonia solani TaxID=456999 RepID=A0A0K6G9T9_9AGAM|nr:hypothetical protein RSOLAG22IIIB_11590 [Rhizoctonia solani]